MKKLIAIVMMLLAVVMVGCNKKPKSPVEERFEQYIQTMNLADDFIQVDSIVVLDSISFPSYFAKLTSWRDSLQDSINNGLQVLTSNLDAMPMNLLLTDAVDIENKLIRIETQKKKAESEAKEKISIFLEDYPDNKCYQKVATIYATFKSGQRAFYARKIAFEDTITISEDIDKGRTRKLQRLEHYIDDYLIEAIAPRRVLLEDVKKLSNKVQ